MRPADRVRSFLPPATRTLRLLAPVALLAVLTPAPRAAVSSHVAAPTPARDVVATPEAGDEITSVRREVRLRKLHLVRPDLIQYPLSYDVFC
jgi:hypothetical protein